MDAVLPISQLIYFVLPENRHLPSGGNVYNEKLIAALREQGQAVEVVDFETYRKAILQDKAGIYGVDSLFVDDMQALLGVKCHKAYSFFILHHLQSMYPPEGSKSEEIFDVQERNVLQFFQAFLLTSDFSKNYLLQKGIQAPMVVVEPANNETLSSSRPQPFPLKALMVANVVARKGILAFLEALMLQVKEDDAFTLNIIGRKDMERDYYEACVSCVEASLLKKKVCFLGAMRHDETLQQYAQHHLFISAAQMETFGMAIQEAKSYGLPILLHTGGFSAHHLSSGAGILSSNTFKLAGNFIELCRNASQLAQLMHSARVEVNVFEEYGWNQAATHFLTFLRNFYA